MNTSKERLNEIAKMKDEDIDTSDIPELDDQFWQNAKLVMPEKKVPIHIMLDKDIIEFFKSRRNGERGYQTDINSVLRTFVDSQRQHSG